MNLLFSIGCFSAKYPKATMAVSLIVALILCAGVKELR